MGDDTAVLENGTGNLLTTDSLVFGRHFDEQLDPAKAGAKLLKRNLSDIAAMGGAPGAAVLAGFLSPHTSIAWLGHFVRGLATCALQYDVSIVGGDLTETPGFLGFNLTLTGRSEHPLLRGKAQVGDHIWVTGELGNSIAGHHASFTPRLPEGAWLAKESAIRAMIDVTDGLAKDLPALLSPGTAAAIDLKAIPLRAGCKHLAQAFTDGEDYELLFLADPTWVDTRGPMRWFTASNTRLTCIGKITTAKTDTALLRDSATDEPLDFGSGYAHFG